MPGMLKQATAATVKMGPFVDDTDGKTAETALTITKSDVRLSKNGGDFVEKSDASSATHDENGYYDVPLDTSDTGAPGRLKVAISESGALPVWDDFMVLPAMVYEGLIGGGDTLQVETASMVSNVITAGVIAAGAIDADAFAAGAIDATAIGTGAIDADALAADFSTELIAALLNTINTTATFNTLNSVGRQIRTASLTGQIAIRQSTCQAGSTSTTVKLDANASSINNLYNGNIIVLTGGTGAGQSRRIIGYNGSTKVATVDRAWVVIPTGTTTFQIYAATSSILADEGTAQSGGASSIQLATTASTTDDLYVNSFVTIVAGTGSGQTRIITAYTGSTRTATVDSAWDVQPNATSVYAVIPSGDAAADTGPQPPTAAEVAVAVGNRTVSTLEAVPESPFTADEILAWLLAVAKNKRTQTATLETLYQENASTTLATSVKSDNGTTFTRNAYD